MTASCIAQETMAKKAPVTAKTANFFCLLPIFDQRCLFSSYADATPCKIAIQQQAYSKEGSAARAAVDTASQRLKDIAGSYPGESLEMGLPNQTEDYHPIVGIIDMSIRVRHVFEF